MTRSDTYRREAEAARILSELADRMDNCDAHAAELLLAADWVRNQVERLK